MKEPQTLYEAMLYDNIEYIREYIGSGLEIAIAIEELSELILAVSKAKRYRCVGIYRENLIKKIANARIVVDELMMIFDISDDEYQKAKDAEIQRLEKRMSAK